jgi:hypothetical protein
MINRSYEIYQRRGDDWVIVGASDVREDAMATAHAMVEAFPRSQVQVIEERYDPATTKTAATILFRGNKETLTAPRPKPRKPTPARLAASPLPSPPPRSHTMLIAWATGLAAIAAIAFFGLNWLVSACR